MKSALLLTLLSGMVFSEPIRLPKTLDCRDNSGEKHFIVTRLDEITDRSAIPDDKHSLTVWDDHTGAPAKKNEVGYGWRGEYFSATVNEKYFSYNLWTCDTEDRFYTFETSDLIAKSDAKSQVVGGKLVVEIRDLHDEYALNCVAKY